MTNSFHTESNQTSLKPAVALSSLPVSPPARRVSPRMRTTSPGAVIFGLVTTRAGFSALRDDWQELESRAGTQFNYFQTFDWNWKWYDHVADPATHQLAILTVRRHGRLALVWPMMIVREAGLRVVKWLSEPHLQYGDVLIEAHDGSQDLLERTWNHLLQLRSYDLVLLNKVLDTANASALLKQHCKTVNNGSVASQLNISGYANSAEFTASLSRKRRRRHVKRRRTLAQQGHELTFHVHHPGPEFVNAVEAALSFKRDWLVNTGLMSQSLFEPETERFLASLSSQKPHDAREIAAELKLDGRTIAVETGFVFKSHYYAYLGAFDWELRNFSPGKVQMHDMVSWCIDNSISHYDLLGTPAAYKSEWSNETIEMQDFCAARSPAAEVYVRLWLGTVRPAAKNMFENLAPKWRRALLKGVDLVTNLFSARRSAL